LSSPKLDSSITAILSVIDLRPEEDHGERVDFANNRL
jgi:hypothetical protein